MAVLQRGQTSGACTTFSSFFMTNTSTPAEDHLCDACAGIQRNWRKAPGHAELMQRRGLYHELYYAQFEAG
ncbi:hypothetical protein SDC9_171522 [bioreactor metagenome]|uniref:Uncharacterized protein n=1 Tax=bioreactor metagenome TaxID=1076179 RepID=A0A645GB32_9ZZZZ